jgi:hypothetical protein
MGTKIDVKHSNIAGVVPTTSSINLTEVAINTYDGRVFIKKDNGVQSIVELGGSPGGSNTQIQYNNNGSFGGSSTFTFNSGSNTLTLTGSLRITGSTTQTGNNTLIGNTLLSGSIIISGSQGPGALTSSVQIYGDIRQSGYHRFDPVTTNIDTSISASYIYVSGSTNDLYFSQNGSGYNNVTRLRWLEGNLYTGLLHGGIISASIGGTTFTVASGSGIIVNLNTSTGSDPYPVVQFLTWPNLSASIASLSASYDQQFVAINSSAQIFAQGIPYNDGDYNTKIPIGIVIHQNHSTINAAQTFPGVAYGWKQRSFDFIKAFGPLKISGYTLRASSSLGLLLDGGISWVDGRNYAVDPNNPSYITEATGIATSKIYYYYQSGSEWNYLTNNGAGYANVTASLYSNSGSLTALSTNNKWSIQRVYYFPNSATKAFYVYFGNAQYDNYADALTGISNEGFLEAPNTAANAIFVGYMLLQKTANFTTTPGPTGTWEFRSAGLFRGVSDGSGGSGGGGGGGATSLAGLTDVNISGETNGQPLVYDTLSTKWINSNALTASLFGTASWANNAITASLSSTSSYVNTLRQNVILSGSLTLISGSSTENLIIVKDSTVPSTFITITPDSIGLNAGGYLTAIQNPLNANSNGTVRLPAGGGSDTLVISINGEYADDNGAVTLTTIPTASYVNPLKQNVIITGSLTVSGSSTFTNIGPAIFSGSVTSTSGFTGSLQGTSSFATTASFALTAAGGTGGISQGKVVAIVTGYSNLF